MLAAAVAALSVASLGAQRRLHGEVGRLPFDVASLRPYADEAARIFDPVDQGPEPAAMLPAEWYDEDEWHLLVRYIITPAEGAAYRRVKTAADRESFIAAFWARRDPTPDTPRNEFREEFDRRVDYVNTHFTNPDDAPHTGLETDRGRIYVMFGAPDSVMTFTSGAFELWRYSRAPAAGMTFQFSLPPIDSCDGSFRIVSPTPIATIRSGMTSVEVAAERFVTVRIHTGFTDVASIAHTLRTGGAAVLEADAAFWDGKIGPAGKDPLSRHILGCRMFETGGMGFTHPLPPGTYVFTTTVTLLNGTARKDAVRFVVP
ncbi:MAG TPA: GWxTD domain-containing protein [Vicinamibacterales bacterium]|nr:GWxTD domain-containing protein [Vicinamibacterales bacterium]